MLSGSRQLPEVESVSCFTVRQQGPSHLRRCLRGPAFLDFVHIDLTGLRYTGDSTTGRWRLREVEEREKGREAGFSAPQNDLFVRILDLQSLR